MHNIGQSVLSKLKNKAINEGVDFSNSKRFSYNDTRVIL